MRNRFFRRVLDMICALFLSLLFTPLMLVITLLVFLRDGGSPFFLHERVGQGGRTIKVLKFRTMKRHAEELSRSIQSIHGTTSHTGAVPSRQRAKLQRVEWIKKRKNDLQDAIRREDYEAAARLRDEIRELEQNADKEDKQ